jgi:hypothetical protein
MLSRCSSMAVRASAARMAAATFATGTRAPRQRAAAEPTSTKTAVPMPPPLEEEPAIVPEAADDGFDAEKAQQRGFRGTAKVTIVGTIGLVRPLSTTLTREGRVSTELRVASGISGGETVWHRVLVYNRSPSLQRYLVPGARIALEGVLAYFKYQTPDAHTHKAAYIRCSEHSYFQIVSYAADAVDTEHDADGK